MANILIRFILTFKELLWKPKCEQVILWEKKKGITQTDKITSEPKIKDNSNQPSDKAKNIQTKKADQVQKSIPILLAVISALIVLPINSEVTIYTDSNNVITGYYDIIDRNNFIISPRKFFKIRTNNIYWSILREIIVTNNLTLDFIKVKRHSDNYFNNYIDEFITHTDETLNLVFKANNLNNLDYVSH
ncbi:hypothetical protein RhiirA1_459767 [Rhizophagus irregularis]|uniref:RNase H type-1 domain-containing protein n=1 Tax=Rhizophagus irregularis TaxID=588596 RepID=A0A2N0RSU4_9GLOM|nr:hypothetical protein RhiirA1_459767 [Rhizophagus irregularis]